MRRRTFNAMFAWILAAAVLCAADAPKLSREDRQSEVEWLTSLGLKVREGGLLLEDPYSEPLSFRSFVAPSAWWRAPFPTAIPAAQLRKDLPLLRLVMEKAYGGWASAQKRGWDWNRWFTEWDAELASKGEALLTPTEALAAVGRLEDFQLDNHSGPVGGPVRFQSGSRTAVLEHPPSAGCNELRDASGGILPLDAGDPAQRPKSARIDATDAPGFYISYPVRRGAVTAIHCGDWIPVRPTWSDPRRKELVAALAQNEADVPSYRAISGTIGYLRLPVFSKPNGELLRKLLPTLPKSAGQEKLLIVDMRGNGGGDAPIEAMGRWVDGAAIRRAANFSKVLPKSCLYEALRWGYTQVSSQSLKPPISPQLRGNMQRQVDALYNTSPAGCPVKIEEAHVAWDYRQHRWQAAAPAGKPRLLVLVDGGCGSDCEYMTSVLAAQPGTVIAGENTYGVGQFIQPGFFILPNSRVKFRIALGMSDFYGDSRSFDGYGVDVDLVLTTEEVQSAPAIIKLGESLLAK